MRKKVEALKETLKGFIEQRDYVTMVVNASEQDMLLLLKVLQGLEQESPYDIFLVFGDGGATASEYVSNIVKKLDVQLMGANEIREKEGLMQWSPLPPHCWDTNEQPSIRLLSVMEYIRQLFPIEEGNRILWGFLPISIASSEEYLKAIEPLLPRNDREPWMRGQRILVRNDRKEPFLMEETTFDFYKRVLYFDIDLSPEAMTSALVEEAQDPEATPDQRMESLLQLAGLDFAYRRYEQATEKYGVLFNYYKEKDQPAMQAVCLCGHGDVLRQLGRVEEAQSRYQQGLALAVPSGSLPVMLNLLLAVGDSCLTLNHNADAEGYFNYASLVAGKMFNVYAKCDAMEKCGIAQAKQQKEEEALQTWRLAADLAKKFDYYSRQKSSLEHMSQLYTAKGMVEAQIQCRKELNDLEVAIKKGS